MEKRNILIIGPLPPPYGGVSNFIKNMCASSVLKKGNNVYVYRTGRKVENVVIFTQILSELFRIFKLPFSEKFKKADIIHIHSSSYLGFMYNSIYLRISKIFNHRAKVIFHYHGGGFWDFYCSSNPFIRYYIKNSFKISDLVIFTSKNWCDRIKKISNKMNTLHIYNGFDPINFYQIDKLYARKYFKLPYDKKIILNVSNLYPIKGQLFLIKAMKKILEKDKNILLLIIGEGPLKEKLQKQITMLKLENNVKLLGFSQHDKLSLWMNAADLFVLPSLSEGNPTVMFEALGVGLPFVGTRVGGVPEIITSDEYGLLAEPGNADDLAEKILIALEKEWDRDKIRKYASQFTWENIARQLMKVYEDVLNKNHPGE